jgi:hypothetical protein
LSAHKQIPPGRDSIAASAAADEVTCRIRYTMMQFLTMLPDHTVNVSDILTRTLWIA